MAGGTAMVVEEKKIIDEEGRPYELTGFFTIIAATIWLYFEGEII